MADDPISAALLRHEIGMAVHAVEVRLEAMDKATAVLSETVNRVPTALQIAISNVKSEQAEVITGINQQFNAIRELIQLQRANDIEARNKAERANEALLTKIESILNTTKDGLTDRVNANERRLSALDAANLAQRQGGTDSRANITMIIAAIGVIVALIFGVVGYHAGRGGQEARELAK